MAAPKPVRAMNPERIKIFTGTANPALAEDVCRHLGLELGAMKLQRLSDGEINLQILENVRGADCFVVQPTCMPVDFHLMELLEIMDTLRLSSAERITAVVFPTMGTAVRIGKISRGCRFRRNSWLRSSKPPARTAL